MRADIKPPPHLAASGHGIVDPMAKRGSCAQTARALREWTEKNPNPFTPRSRAASQQFHNQNQTSK